MKYSYKWLKELSGTKKSAEEVAELFLTHSFEVEGIEDLARGLDKVVVGEVLETEKHPDADRLNVAKVNVGDKNGGELQIVCGAPNLEVGQKVPVALVGAKIRPIIKTSTAKEEIFEIKKSKIRGVESFGMICAEDELGLGNEHEGIMVLAEDAKIGQNFAEYMGLKDKILDIDILPNRGHDCLSYKGVARELQALENFEFPISNFDSNSNDRMLENKDLNSKEENKTLNNSSIQSKFKIQNSKLKDDLKVEIDTSNCSRYAGVKIKNIEIKESPQWIQARLKASGLKPINNIVDITNYVMLETNQPLHVFDSELVESQKSKVKSRKDVNYSQLSTLNSQILIRQAKKGEKIKLLDEQELELMKDDIVITDGEESIALAGVMGGLDSGVQDDTTEIILEGANFNSTNIRFTARRYNLQTDAAYRFERDIDPNFVDEGVSRAVELIQELAGGEVVAVTDIYPEPIEPWTVNLDTDYVRRLLGVEIEDKKVKSILERLGIEVNEQRIINNGQKEGATEFKQTEKVLQTLKKIKQEADKQNIKFWVLGGLAIAFHVGEIYREHDDLDIIAKRQEDHKTLLDILKQLGFKKIEEKKISDKLIGLVYKNNTEVEILIGEYLGELGLVDSDFEDNEREIAGVKVLTLSKRFLVSVKERQLKNRNKEKDKLDLDYLNKKITESRLVCIIPTRRRDLRTQEDLIEEVGRIYGYDKIEPKPIQAPVQTPHRNEQRFFERKLKEISVQNGFSEIRSYSFHSEQDAEILGLKNLKHIELLNPASPEQQMMRNTLAVGILKAGRKSLSHFKEVRIFEIGKTYRVKNHSELTGDIELVDVPPFGKGGLGGISGNKKILQTVSASEQKIPLNPPLKKGEEQGLPEEILSFSGGVFNKSHEGEQFYETKGLIDTILESFGVSDLYYDDNITEDERPLAMPELHPSRQALLKTSSGKIIGWLGEVNKKTSKHFGLKNVRGTIFEIEVDKLREQVSQVNSFQPLPKFPFVERDLSMIVGKKLRVAEVENMLYKVSGKLLQDVDLFDLYQNKETGERSMAFHLLFGDSERTLQAKEVDEAVNKIIETLEKELDVEVKK